MDDQKLPRRVQEKINQRRRMLDTALELFAQRGYHNVSMHEIAHKSEFAIGTLYKFFRNKEDLYRALLLEQADRFHDALTKALAGPEDEIEKLRNYVRVKGEVFQANASLIRLYFAETQGARFNVFAGFDREIRERFSGFLEKLAAVFENGIRRKRMRKIADPYHLAIALNSLTNAFLFLWLEAPVRHPYPDNPDTILNILFHGLIPSGSSRVRRWAHQGKSPRRGIVWNESVKCIKA